MAHQPFQYDNALLSSCASSKLAAQVSSLQKPVVISSGEDYACRILFEQHSTHYGRRTLDADNAESLGPYKLSDRMQKFVANVVLVDRHNRNLRKNSSVLHEVALNQFADVLDHELPFGQSEDLDALFDSIWNGEQDKAIENLFEGVPFPLVRLDGKESIMKVASKSNSAMYEKSHKKKNRKAKHHHKDRDPYAIPPSAARKYPTLKIAEDLDVNDFAKYNENDSANQNVDDSGAGDKFRTYLNWATTDNPDGVAIVHPVMDQGVCGSCWAFAATGTLEASCSRRAAYQTYTDIMQKNAPSKTSDGHVKALAAAQESERYTISVANLSVQELVDCDTAVDQGCTGGNPLLAFYFIHRFGLTSWENYPYVGDQEKCRAKRVADPIATVQSWGILTPNHESNMELVLRYIGPIAVGINGADPTFLAYKGGIFYSENCDQAANHALLIVGHGEERNQKGVVVKYWIARNTWGIGWGENGYIRVKRGDGSKGTAGVCGLAKNPSVALGGTLLETATVQMSSRWEEYVRRGGAQRLENSELLTGCSEMRHGTITFGSGWQCVVEYHRALLFGVVSVIIVALFVVWPLSSDCRARERRLRRQRRRSELRHEEISSCAEEESSLLESQGTTTTYGANTFFLP